MAKEYKLYEINITFEVSKSGRLLRVDDYEIIEEVNWRSQLEYDEELVNYEDLNLMNETDFVKYITKLVREYNKYGVDVDEDSYLTTIKTDGHIGIEIGGDIWFTPNYSY